MIRSRQAPSLAPAASGSASGDRLSTASAHHLPALIEQLLRARTAQELQRVAEALRQLGHALSGESNAMLGPWVETLIDERHAQIEQRDQSAANLLRLENAVRL